MKEQFICQVCNKGFDSQEELVSHMITKHTVVKTINKSNEVEELKNKLYQELECDDNTIKINIIEDDQIHNARFFIILNHGDFVIQQGYQDLDTYSISRYPETYKELIQELEVKYSTISKIFKGVKSLGECDCFAFKSFIYGHTLNETGFWFELTPKNGDRVITLTYRCFEEGYEDFISSLKQYFLDELEGGVTSTDNGYYTTYYVDGVDVQSLLCRGKKVRIEILD